MHQPESIAYNFADTKQPVIIVLPVAVAREALTRKTLS